MPLSGPKLVPPTRPGPPPCPLGDDRLDPHVEIGGLGQLPLGGLARGRGTVDPPGLGLSEGRDGMLQAVLGHQFVGDDQIRAGRDARRSAVGTIPRHDAGEQSHEGSPERSWIWTPVEAPARERSTAHEDPGGP